MIISKSTLLNNILSELSDNSTGQISPRDIRHNLVDIIDSIHLLTEGSNIESLNLGTPDIRSVRIGLLSLDSLNLDGYTSTDNIAVGYAALKSSYQTRRNTAVGSYALSCNIHGDANVALGYNALAGNTTGYSNVALGTHTLNNNKRGNFNIAIGNAAGYYIGPDDDYKFYLASHPIDESYICDNPNGANLTPLMHGDLNSNVLGLNTNSLHSNSTLQVGGNVSPSTTSSFTLGVSSYVWSSGYIGTVLNGDTKVVLGTNDLTLTSNDNIIFNSSGIYLNSNEIKFGGHLLPDQHATHDIGSIDNRFNKAYFEELLTDYVTALQKSFFSNKTLYLASSGEWAIDGGGPSSLYEYYPCPSSPDPVAILDDNEIDGGGLVLQSTSDQYKFIFKSTDDVCGSTKRWYSNIGLEISGVNSYLKTPSVISTDSLNCYGIFMSGEQVFFAQKDLYENNHNIAGDGQISFYAPSGGTQLDEFIISHASVESGVDISQRYLSSAHPVELEDGKQKLTGFETKYFDEELNSRLVTRSYSNSSKSNNHIVLMNQGEGCVGINNFTANGQDLVAETIFNVRSSNDAIARVTAENDASSFAALQLFAPQNCANSGVEIFYQNNSGIFGLNIFDDFNKHEVLHSDNGDYLGIYATSGTGDLVTIGNETYTNASIALYERSSTPSNQALYGKIYVSNKDFAGQSQTLNFMDEEGNNFNLVRNTSDSADGLIYSENGNTFGGLNCPDVRGDTPNASNNTAYGDSTLNDITNGDCNTFYGYNAGSTITTGSQNVGIGCNVMLNASGDVSNNIVIGSNGMGQGLDSNHNLLIGSSNGSPLITGKLGPRISDKRVDIVNGSLNVQSLARILQLTGEKIEIQDFSGSDYPDEDFSVSFAGNENSDLMVWNHNSNPFETLFSYKTFNPSRPFVEVKGDVRVKGAVAFRDGSFMESASELNSIGPALDRLNNIFIEGVSLENIDPAHSIESPTQGIVKNRLGGLEHVITNRDPHSKIKKGDYIIAIKIGQEYRPIWISNESSSCTCCTK